MVKRYDKQTFSANVGGVEYNFYCHTTNTRCGFCHTVCTQVDGSYLRDTKVSYLNRTWESFTYETALKRAIEKCPKVHQQALRDIIIDKKAQDEHEKAEAFVDAFKSEYDKLSDKNKEILKNSPHITSEGQAKSVLGLMKIMNVLG